MTCRACGQVLYRDPVVGAAMVASKPAAAEDAADAADAADAMEAKDVMLEPAPPPALVYPAKLTERERDDMAQQLAAVPAEIA